MKWVEIIRLRLTRKSVDDDLLNSLVSVSDEEGLVELTVYHNDRVDTDVSIHLEWESDIRSPRVSPLGLRMAEALKDLGLVDHSIWIQDKKSIGLANQA